ncbi:Bug family tripartite tricarboxylate transporter substrate binding protein [Roseomonas sp. BN140053]|uniref:Bug family tripartite tricarboxylate transporter substrate binding protein n=1 Tax=Roseomonas sp. BN140053 TaxID=3391898 RepID=UPI0039EC2F0B
MPHWATRRRSVLLAGLLAPKLARAAWPEQPVRIVSPAAPGDGGDTLGRVLAAEFEKVFNRPFVVENRTGAGGRVASDFVAHAAPDGYTLMVANAGSHGINGAIYRSLPFDLVRDFTPITLLLEAPSVLVVNARTLPVRSLAEFMAKAREAPGGLAYASGGVGGSSHMSMELFRARTGIEMVHVPFRGAGGAVTALTAGEPAAMFVNLPSVLGALNRGDLRALAVTSLTRAPELPEVPTLDEAGVPGYETIAWFGLVAPAGVPPAVVETIRRETQRAIESPEVVERLRNVGGTLRTSTPQEFSERIAQDVAMWRRVVAERGLTLE